MPSAVRINTGALDFSGGVNSAVVPLIASARNPNGLKPNQCAWANNCIFDAGAIAHRPGLEYITTLPIVAQFNDAYLYEPAGEFPYLVSYIGGRVFRTRVDLFPVTTDEITQGNLDPAAADLGFTVQAEEFLIHQCGDATTLPTFWDGNTMRRSAGAAQVLGVVSIAAVVPAVGSPVLLTLTAPYAGAAGQQLYINGAAFSATASGNFVTLKNLSNGAVGSTVPAGASINVGNSSPSPTLITNTTADFVIPPIGSTVVVAVQSSSGLTVNQQVGVTNAQPRWEVTAKGLPAAGANQVYVTNLEGIPGDPIAIGDTLESIQELPAGQAMDYYMGRVWIANGREYLAGDIVGGPSGTPAYGFRDSVLKMTENAFTISGGAFIVPSQAGNIRALKHPANLDTSLGEGQLLPMTRRNIYSTNVTPTRADWALLTEPIQRVAQINFGTVGDRSVVTVNADLYYQSVDGVRSFKQGRRNVETGPGNTPLSQEEKRVLDLNDRSMLRWATGVEFNTRLLQSALPFQTPVGVAHRAIMPLNFDPLNVMAGALPPIWEGVWEGVFPLKVLKGDFGGRQRCFLIVWSELNQAIEVWEQTNDAQEDLIAPAQVDPAIPDSEHSRITWSFELPAWDWGDPFQMKELDTIQIFLDRLSGLLDVVVEYRPSAYSCWIFWHRFSECQARNECELPNPLLPCDHPTQQYPPCYRSLITLPKPPIVCNECVQRPSNIDTNFQVRITLKGSCRIRGILAHALLKEMAPYEGLRCQ